jgi:hypothetical protein
VDVDFFGVEGAEVEAREGDPEALSALLPPVVFPPDEAFPPESRTGDPFPIFSELWVAANRPALTLPLQLPLPPLAALPLFSPPSLFPTVPAGAPVAVVVVVVIVPDPLVVTGTSPADLGTMAGDPPDLRPEPGGVAGVVVMTGLEEEGEEKGSMPKNK